MLKQRLVGVVIVRDGVAVQSIGFRRFLPIGAPAILVSALDQWGIDEIVVLDISATRRASVDLRLCATVSRACQVPLAFGGGIHSADDMTRVVQAGADKVVVNHAFLEDERIVAQGAARLGSQCIIVSVDVVREGERLRVYDHAKRARTEKDPVALARLAESSGAGEVFITSVERDGSKTGYDLDLAAKVAGAVRVPVVVCGGVGHHDHFSPALAIPNVSGVAAANYFSFTEHSVTVAKQLLKSRGKSLRHDTSFRYEGAPLGRDGRLARRDERELAEMLFAFHPRETI